MSEGTTKEVWNLCDYKVGYTTTLTPGKPMEDYTPEEQAKILKAEEEFATKAHPVVLGDWVDYVCISSMIRWSRKNWVPFWLWKLVADAHFIEDQV